MRRHIGRATWFIAALLSGLACLAGAAQAQAQPSAGPSQTLAAIVAVHATVSPQARTARYLGTAREGSGVLIDSSGLVVTIGYLVTEATAIEIGTADGKTLPATLLGL